INEALQVHVKATGENEEHVLTMEVALHLGDHVVRTISMSGTDGLQRGSQVTSTGSPISVPVGDETLGRVFNVLGDHIDLGDEIPESVKRVTNYREENYYETLSTGTEIMDNDINIVY